MKEEVLDKPTEEWKVRSVKGCRRIDLILESQLVDFIARSPKYIYPRYSVKGGMQGQNAAEKQMVEDFMKVRIWNTLCLGECSGLCHTLLSCLYLPSCLTPSSA